MSLMMIFCAILFPRDILDEIWDLIESVSEGFSTYNYKYEKNQLCKDKLLDRNLNLLKVANLKPKFQFSHFQDFCDDTTSSCISKQLLCKIVLMS